MFLEKPSQGKRRSLETTSANNVPGRPLPSRGRISLCETPSAKKEPDLSLDLTETPGSTSLPPLGTPRVFSSSAISHSSHFTRLRGKVRPSASPTMSPPTQGAPAF